MIDNTNPSPTPDMAHPIHPKDHLPLLHFPLGMSAWRHTISPGLFEYVCTDGCKGTGELLRFPTALQPVEKCEKLLCANETERVIPCPQSKSRGAKISTNDLQAVGAGEDRLAVDAINWGDVEGFHGQPQGQDGADSGNVAKATIWGRWGDLTKDDEDQTARSKDLLFCSVFDGHGCHGGAETAEMLRLAAHALLTFGLASNPLAAGGEDEQAVIQAIKDVYVTISKDLSNASLSILTHPETSYPLSPLPSLPSMAQLLRAILERQGSCMATCIIDLKRAKVYIANLGDVRVVAIWTNVITGKKRVEAVTEDHNGCNEAEVQRVKAAHPTDPNAMIAIEGQPFSRVLGNIMISRGVGDIHYNRPEAERQELLAQGVHPNSWVLPHPTIDPPYIAWEPAVVVRHLTEGSGEGQERLSGLIIASDGLWDKMSNEEAALAHLAHLADDSKSQQQPHTNADLLDHFPLINFDPVANPEFDKSRQYLFQDTNAATHLIRNGISDGNPDQLREMLSLRQNTKTFRDDTAVIVIDFGSLS